MSRNDRKRRKKKLKQKNKLLVYNKALDGIKIGKINNEDEQEALNIFNDFIIAEAFWYTPDEILQMPEKYYSDFLLLLNLRAAKEAAKAKRDKTRKF